MQWSIVGHAAHKTTFERVVKRDAFVHAYLLTGPSMVGKRSFAHDLIRENHKGIEQGTVDQHTTVISVGERTSIPIDDIRAVRKALSLQAPEGVRRFILIDDAEGMTHEASNALLKILEEPPVAVTFFLVSSAPGALLETIQSRCHEVRFNTLSDVQMAECARVLRVPAGDCAEATLLAGGRPGWLTRTHNEGSLKRALQDIEQFRAYLSGGMAERLVWAKELAGQDDIRGLVLQWIASERGGLRAGTVSPNRVHGLLGLHEALGNASFNTRLCIEDFFLRAV